ncbi:MAG: hypothetical protein HKN63_11785 [Rhodobacteraceae bacterium]|nr:hypothetical protein [Paracoccaceae bacterium]
MTRTLIAAVAVAATFALSPAAEAKPDRVNNTADVLHPNIHQKVGTGANANPNGANAQGGNIHGIANVPGKGGDNPNDDGVPGQANELETTHGGIGAKNKNAN